MIEIWKTSGPEEAIKYADAHSYPRLHKFIAEQALLKLDLMTSQKEFVKCSDYQGMQLLKKMQKIDDQIKRKAEAAIYFEDFDEAERLYLSIDRKDLAMDLRSRLGEWFRVVHVIKAGGEADDRLLEDAWNNIGDYYFERQKW